MNLQALGSEDGVEGSREVAIAIVDQEARLGLRRLNLPGQVPRLLGGPGSAWVLAAGGEQDAPAGQLQEEQDVEALQEGGVHREVVTGQDCPALSPQEAAPGESCPPRSRRDAVAAEQVADATRGDPMAELEQLASDALVTPEGVLPGQRQHQLPPLGRQIRSAGTAAAAKRCPAVTDQRPVPAKDGRRLHQEQGPSRQLAAEGSQDQAVRRPPARASSGGRRTSNSWRRARSSRSRSAVGRPRRMRRSISRRRMA